MNAKGCIFSVFFALLFIQCNNSTENIDRKPSTIAFKKSFLNEEMPEFKFFDIKGDMFSSSNTRNKLVLFYCFSIKSKKTIANIPNLKSLQERYIHRKDIEFVGLANESEDQLKGFYKTWRLDFGLCEKQYPFSKKILHVEEFPCFIIKKSKNIVTFIGTDFNEMKTRFDSLALEKQ